MYSFGIIISTWAFEVLYDRSLRIEQTKVCASRLSGFRARIQKSGDTSPTGRFHQHNFRSTDSIGACGVSNKRSRPYGSNKTFSVNRWIGLQLRVVFGIKMSRIFENCRACARNNIFVYKRQFAWNLLSVETKKYVHARILTLKFR